jgi:Zn finger protein HypA/HybF involved in hydrogenase expression
METVKIACPKCSSEKYDTTTAHPLGDGESADNYLVCRDCGTEYMVVYAPVEIVELEPSPEYCSDCDKEISREEWLNNDERCNECNRESIDRENAEPINYLP